MNFKEWLKIQEVGTGTNAIAVFSRRLFDEPVRRATHDEFILGGQIQNKKDKKASRRHDWEGQIVS